MPKIPRRRQEQARDKDKEAAHVEDQALRFDFGEGLLEIGAVVLTSMYFISRSKLFPTVGVIAATAGVVIAAMGYFV